MTKSQKKILAHEVKAIRIRDIIFVKVMWQNHKLEEATWERRKGRDKREIH